MLVRLWTVLIKILLIWVDLSVAQAGEEVKRKRIEMLVTVISLKMRMEIYTAKNLFFPALSTKKVKSLHPRILKKDRQVETVLLEAQSTLWHRET